MARFVLVALIGILVFQRAAAQQSYTVRGTVADSLGAAIGVTVKLKTAQDSAVTTTGANGSYYFPKVTVKSFTLTVTGLGYRTFTRRYAAAQTDKPVLLDPIRLKASSKTLKTVEITAVNPITIKEDTIEYKASAYPVREGSMVEEMIKKLPGISVDQDGNITAQGKQVTKVRVNGKDYFTGDVQTATRNLPADIIENIQIIDDYGDLANINGIKTGDPDKIINITIQKGKRVGEFGQATAGVGDHGRYVGNLSANAFKDDTQLALLGTLNNNNTNAFNFGGSGGGGGRGGQSGGGTQASTANGITVNKSLGFNYRDSWGKKMTVYSSYSFGDRDKTTLSTSEQQNLFQSGDILSSDNTTDRNHNINHRFDFNLEYKIDTANYLKINPKFSDNTSNDVNNDIFSNTRQGSTTRGNEYSQTHTSSPSGGASLLYNHRFQKKGRNFSITANYNFSKSNTGLNDQYNTRRDSVLVPLYQLINTNSSTQTFNAHFSYLEPLGKTTYLEANYTYNYSNTDNNRSNYRVDPGTGVQTYVDSLSTLYNYQFITHTIGLNLRGIKPKYNYTIGLAARPAELKGESYNLMTENHTFNLVPTAHFVYNFSRNHVFNFNYSGTTNQPSFTQLQTRPDYSDPQNVVYGNPNLKPSFTNNITARYNQFDIKSGASMFFNFNISETQNSVVSNTQPILNKILNPGNSRDSTAQETHYLNTNGAFSTNGNYSISQPFDNRKFTVTVNGGVGYNNNVNFIEGQRDLAKNFTWNQGAKVRIDIDSLMDTDVSASYSANNTHYSIPSTINTNARTWTLGLDGRNYFFNDFVLGYDLTQTINHGFSATVNANPTLFSSYLEYQFLTRHMASLRFQAFDIFDENKGVTRTVSGNQIIDTRTNRLGRYFLLSFTIRLQKFKGSRPGRGGFGGGRGSRGGFGGGGRRGGE